MNKNLCIIGCGWLGQFVGKELKTHFKKVYASYRSEPTESRLKQYGFYPFQLDLEKGNSDVPENVIKTTTHLIIAMPPFDRGNPESYGDKLLKTVSKFNPETHVIFTSSTGIYPQENCAFDENYNCSTGNILCHAERMLLSHFGEDLTVLRLGGLIGGQRHPIKFLSGKNMSNSGEEPINLIHRKDISRLIEHLFVLKLNPGILNVSYALDMDKRTYYDTIADKFGMPHPNWGAEHPKQRIISTEKLQKLNGFDLIFNPLDFTFE